jgi:C4-dicarboxylate transporter DctM subunit
MTPPPTEQEVPELFVAAARAKPRSRIVAGLHRIEDLAAGIALAAMFLLPMAEVVLRRLGTTGIPGSIPFVQHLTLWVAFLGAALAAREHRLLALATGALIPEGPAKSVASLLTDTVAASVSALLCVGAVQLVHEEYVAGTEIALGLRAWVAQLVLPIAFGLIAVRLAWQASPRRWGRLVALLGAAMGAWWAYAPAGLVTPLTWPLLGAVLIAALLGAPIFTVLGGVAALLFVAEQIPPAAVLIETYGLGTDPTLPAIPLFTLAGFLLAEGRASERLLRIFRAWFGWMPGGTAIVCTLLSAFFTVFTGGSGVTILALGGLLLPALIKDGYKERFSLGLLTGAGSLGLLLPPALPLILFGIVAELPIEDLFIGGILPGLLVIGLVVVWGVYEGMHLQRPSPGFALREALASLWSGKWELLLPVVVLVSLFGGYATLVESAALAALFAFVTQTFINRDFSIRRDFRRVFTDCVVTIGGVLIILGVAVGFTNYLVDAQVPARLIEWTQARVDSRVVFLLGLNLFLLVVGCLMDIFSATFVVVPLILPLGQVFGVDPVHLGIIFIANLELGYLTPPVGLNLFLASYRFKRPLMEIVMASLPMLAIRGVGVLLVTYVPWFTLGLLEVLGRR